MSLTEIKCLIRGEFGVCKPCKMLVDDDSGLPLNTYGDEYIIFGIADIRGWGNLDGPAYVVAAAWEGKEPEREYEYLVPRKEWDKLKCYEETA